MPTVGLSMIVKNAEEDLRDCLKSVAFLVDEIVIADTGSTDGTLEIAREFGAKIVSISWNQHFAEARNACLQHLATDWVLVLDADEELSGEARGQIPDLLRSPETVGGFSLIQRNYLKGRFQYVLGTATRELEGEFAGGHPRADGIAKSCFDNPLCRLFRRDPRIFFRGRIHEVVEHQLAAANLTLIPTPWVIHHFGHLKTSEDILEKHRHYRSMLRRTLEEEPSRVGLWVQLGATEQLHFQDEDRALYAFGKALALQPSHADARISMTKILLHRKQYEEAIAVISHIADTGSEGAYKAEFTGDALHDLGKLKEARRMFTAALRLVRSGSVAPGREARIESKLGYIEVRLARQDGGLKVKTGRQEAGIGKLRRALAALPDDLDCHERLVRALVLSGRDAEAAEAAEAVLQHFASEPLFSRAAALSMRIGRRDQARKILDSGMERFPGSEPIGRLLREMG
ncbi:glycosyltransferase [Silvibacterium dinghuense]|uniref:Tetratricopeptide repeat protein n=1 Tax=Silvibacterium dinghuense TaxID=1560006 RepID=A0A4Q1SIF1_9BACT|nr:glycosyltransferase [Silvibacterium dinghuense]RXS97381.1 tetratricopeptide repeat protein [Silvibacterium dinghuense]GGG98531.1 hypothetical protein GCM10011586_12440 [Silvibacterium dinghuense]